MSADLRLHAFVDRDLCQGHGLCEATAPKIFEVGPDLISVVRMAEIPPELARDARDAELGCPQEAIEIRVSSESR